MLYYSEEWPIFFPSPLPYVFDVCVYCAGNVEWQNSEKTRCLVMWRSPREWGELIYKWVSTLVCLLSAYHCFQQFLCLGFHTSVCGLIYALLSVYLQSFTLSVSLMQAQASGHGNSVCTLYELHSGEDTTEEGKTNTSYVLLSVFYIHWTNMTVTLRGFNMDVNRK